MARPANFADLSIDPIFPTAVQNTVLFVIIGVPLRLLVMLGLALLFERERRGVRLYRSAIYMPTIIPDVAYALIWVWIYNPLYGPLKPAVGCGGVACSGVAGAGRHCTACAGGDVALPDW
ncbi:MAG: sugar ABC transporter permease [Chloroflexaceae bacterium]|nr:sugar ABC transporter permease [Chloroflexaceae bacterium]